MCERASLRNSFAFSQSKTAISFNILSVLQKLCRYKCWSALYMYRQNSELALWGKFPIASPPLATLVHLCASERSERVRFCLHFLPFLSIFCRYFRYFVGINDMHITFCRYRPSVPTVDIGTYRMHHLATAQSSRFRLSASTVGTNSRHRHPTIDASAPPTAGQCRFISPFFPSPSFLFLFFFLSFSSPLFFFLFLLFSFFFFSFFFFSLFFLFFSFFFYFTDDGAMVPTARPMGGGGVSHPHPPP